MILHNFPSYIKKPSAFTFDEVDMNLSTITFSVMVDAEIDPNFQLDWAVEFRGRRFTLQTLLPSGVKNTDSLRYKYDLIFSSEEVELNYYPFLNMVSLDNGDKLPNQSTFAFQGTITEFIDRFNLNLQYHLGDKWVMSYVGNEPDNTTRATISVDNSSLWDMLTQVYDLYSIRWTIKDHTIEIGALAEEVAHIFEYGSKKGLYAIERVNPNDNIYTRLIGQGSTTNLPFDYFKTGDSDTNDIIKSMYFTGLMPKGYRDYIRGWNAGVVKPTETVEYNQGATDKISGRKMQPINYVERNVDKWGVRYGSIQSNPDIYPTIQGMERTGLGRIDEIIAVESVTEDDPESEDFSEYFNVWIKDIGFDLRDPKYWVTERMKMMFSDGMLAGEDYEFELVAEEMGDGSLKPYIYPDTSKSYNGVQSAWRIQLLKSEAELQASGRYLPNKMQNAKAGDHFFLINIALPHEYVLQAEQRVTNWLNEEIVKTSDEYPTYTIKPSAIFLDDFIEVDKIRSGTKIRIADDRLVGDTYLPIYIQSQRISYTADKILPSIELVVTDKVVATRNPIELLQSAVQSLSSGAYSAQQIAELVRQFERFFIRKDIADKARGGTTFIDGITSKSFRTLKYAPGMLGEGATIDDIGNIEAENLTLRKGLLVPELRFNRAEVYTGIQWNTFGGGIIENVVIDVDEPQSGIIKLRLEEGEIGAIAVDDFCMGIFHNFDGANDTANEDQQNGNFRFMGFNTVYFRVTEILDSRNSEFKYTLRGVSTSWTQQHHPSQFMTFASYANPTNKDRQSCSYSSIEYSIRLKNMTTWEYGADNIYEISGKLDGFKIGDTILQGEGQAFGNAYIWGTLQQVYNDPVRMEIEHNGDGFLAFGETMDITCKVFQGWKDITDTVDVWRVTRESGNQNDDTAWNILQYQFNGQITLRHTQTNSDLGKGLSTLFRFEAKAGEITSILYLTF